MKKNYIVILLFIMFMLTGCSSDTVNIDKLTAVAEYQYDTTIQCEAFDKNIKYFNHGSNNNWIVTEDNDVYVYSTYERYSNNSNCIKIADKFDDDIIQVDFAYKSSELGYYAGFKVYYNSRLQKVTVDTKNYQIERENLRYADSSELSADTLAINSSEYLRYRKTISSTAFAINGDNNIYIMSLNSYVNEEYIDKSIIDNEDIVFSVPDDEIILDFYFSSNADIRVKGYNLDTPESVQLDAGQKYILTDKSYYRPMLVDETCQIYLDVPCTYEWKKDEELSKIRNDILYRDEQNLILSNGRVYFNSAYMVN